MSVINREDTINYLMTNMNWHDEDGYPVEDAEEKRAIITDLINGVPDADDGWIPCTDHLPEDYEVLCCDIRDEIMIGHPFSTSESSTGFSAESEYEYMYDCVAWMQKPKGYRPKESEK